MSEDVLLQSNFEQNTVIAFSILGLQGQKEA
jgi:hypothetical protein